MVRVKTSRPAGTKAGLTREDVVEAALALVDSDGASGLSMRRLASVLDVEAQSLYNHVANKQALIDDVVNSLFAGVLAIPTEWTWQERLAEHLRRARACFVLHPRAYDLVLQASGSTVALQDLTEQLLDILDRTGLTGRDQRQAYVFVTSFLDGYIIGERFRSQVGALPADVTVRQPRLAAFFDALQHDSSEDYFANATKILIRELADWRGSQG